MRPWLLALAAAACFGCEAQPCVRQSDCPSGLTCQAGVCAIPPLDAGDASSDVGDAALDAPPERDAPALDGADPLDAGPVDAAGLDAPADPDAGADAGDLDAALDAGAEADAPDAGAEPDAPDAP